MGAATWQLPSRICSLECPTEPAEPHPEWILSAVPTRQGLHLYVYLFRLVHLCVAEFSVPNEIICFTTTLFNLHALTLQGLEAPLSKIDGDDPDEAEEPEGNQQHLKMSAKV